MPGKGWARLEVTFVPKPSAFLNFPGDALSTQRSHLFPREPQVVQLRGRWALCVEDHGLWARELQRPGARARTHPLCQ